MRTHSPCGSFCRLCGRRQAVGQNQGWSARSSLEVVRQSEILRLRVVAFQDSALVRSMRVAWRNFASAAEYRWVGPLRTGRAYRDRGSRQPSLVTVGTSHIVEAGMVRVKTRRYKLCEIRPRRWWRGGLYRVLWRAQHPPGKARWKTACGTMEHRCGRKPTPRGVTVVEDECVRK